ncbi:MAG: metalloregulator ArsR/SmtB family transcription factor [Caulobacteraceae bacterium]
MILSVKQDGNITVEFVYSPFFEMMCSLHVLARPEHHLERLEWAADMKAKLPQALYEELMYFGRNSDEWCGAMDFCDVSDNIVDLNTIAVLDSIADLDSEKFFKVLSNSNQTPSIPSDADSFRRRFFACLKAYYFQFFENELRYMEPLLIRILKGQAVACDKAGLREYAKTIHDRIEVTADKLVFYKYKTFSFDFERIKKITVKISSFISPHLLVVINDPEHIQLTYRAHLQEAAPEVPVDLYKTMRALGDQTRLKILKAIYQGQSSTQSLAVDLKLTEACISKHLKVLYESGLLYKQRKGNYIYYMIKNMQLDCIPMNIYQYLSE